MEDRINQEVDDKVKLQNYSIDNHFENMTDNLNSGMKITSQSKNIDKNMEEEKTNIQELIQDNLSKLWLYINKVFDEIVTNYSDTISSSNAPSTDTIR